MQIYHSTFIGTGAAAWPQCPAPTRRIRMAKVLCSVRLRGALYAYVICICICISIHVSRRALPRGDTRPAALAAQASRSSEPLERAASAGANVTAFGPLGTFGHAGAISLARVMTLAWQLSTEDQLDMYHQLSASLKQHGHLS